MLDVLLPLNGGDSRGVLFVISQRFHAALLREPIGQSLAMLMDAADKITGHTDVKRSARAARQDIDPIAFHAARQHGLPGQARQ